MHRNMLLFSMLCLASLSAAGQPAVSGSMAQPGTVAPSVSLPASSLPKASAEEVERRRRIVEQMDRERDEKERAALRDSPDGQRYCAMMRTQISDAESGVLRGQSSERRLTAEEQRQILPALRDAYEKACR